MIHDGLISENESDVVMLTRSAWAGMQRWGAALWSGDTASVFSTLKISIQAGLNTQMSGMYTMEEGNTAFSVVCVRVPVSYET
jgi:alpha-glucosidase (family GH31 glycosyl hydrolase)